MRPLPNQKISKEVLPVWRIIGCFETLIYGCLPIGYFFLLYYFEFPTWIFWLLIIMVIVIGILKVAIIPTLLWKKWRYEVYESEVDLQFGILVVKRVLIPMIRVQHVDTRQGPLLRRYGLATVTITTAATVHQIPALSEDLASELRDQISKLATEADEDV
ncbi:hypothetical protein DS745_01040 [Anaerobacillus alkaliphilus]|uniref:YdbS-like PH domain-containing protein n=1 Tax=Anaerobacillus alkaliphilus TaxID=1548597 RepID=A0A4Q0VWB8_9BACI|nr:PH domain-containing protein [Anaerobacillus alkaliphilus]RXJ04007.1 hypothetical protein DS745_01040 [Anaerobacillus alkaliphilus]